MKKPSQKISDLKLKIPNPPDPVGSYSYKFFQIIFYLFLVNYPLMQMEK